MRPAQGLRAEGRLAGLDARITENALFRTMGFPVEVNLLYGQALSTSASCGSGSGQPERCHLRPVCKARRKDTKPHGPGAGNVRKSSANET